MDKLIIFDTTLRDGEQSPGASLNKTEKIEIARMWSDVTFTCIEAAELEHDREAIERLVPPVAPRDHPSLRQIHEGAPWNNVTPIRGVEPTHFIVDEINDGWTAPDVDPDGA